MSHENICIPVFNPLMEIRIMKRRIGIIIAVVMIAFGAHGQANEAERIKKNITQMWKDMAQGKIESINFAEHTLTAYSSGGLWENLTGDELSASLLEGPNRLNVKPYHINVTFLGAQKDVSYVTYYLAGNILSEGKVIVPNYRTRISQVLEKRGDKWVWVGTHASPLFGGSGITVD